MTYPLAFGSLSVVLDDRNAYLTMVGGAFRLFMVEAQFTKLIAILRAYRDVPDQAARTVVVRISSPWRGTHDWSLLAGTDGAADVVRYGSEALANETSAELVPDDRDRLISTWDSHHAWLNAPPTQAALMPETPVETPPPSAHPLSGEEKATSEPAPIVEAAAPDQPKRVQLPVIKE